LKSKAEGGIVEMNTSAGNGCLSRGGHQRPLLSSGDVDGVKIFCPLFDTILSKTKSLKGTK